MTHGTGAPAFGSPPAGWTGDAWIGRQPQTNDPTPSWGLFYAEQRVRPFVRRALDRGHLDAAGARVVDRVCDRLAAGDFDDDRPPARIHGDLWSGNVVFTADGAVLIDPAAHGGHGLTDLAMLALFGCPGLDRVARRLRGGRRARRRAGASSSGCTSCTPSPSTRRRTDPRMPSSSSRPPAPSREVRCARLRAPFCRPSDSSATLYRFPPCTAG